MVEQPKCSKMIYEFSVAVAREWSDMNFKYWISKFAVKFSISSVFGK